MSLQVQVIRLLRVLFHLTPRQLILLALGIAYSIYTIWSWSLPYNHVYNYWVQHTQQPSWLFRPKRVPSSGLGTPPIVWPLLCSKWPGDYPIPHLGPPRYNSRDELVSPALLMLHIPSIATPKARQRRQLIRSLNMTNVLPHGLEHLVEMKFILGRPDREETRMPDVIEEEAMVREEQAIYGDIVRLDGLEGGENMDHGKTLDWIRWVGKRERPALWVMKCDDDMLPILPNLLPLLDAADPSIPTYLGSHFGAFMGTHYHFEGMMYGLNWGVVQALTQAPLPRSEIIKFFPEDGRMGELMYSLPSKPSCPTHPQCYSPHDPSSSPYSSSASSSSSSDSSRTSYFREHGALHRRRLRPYPPKTPPPRHPLLPSSGDPCDPYEPPGGRTWDHHPPNPDPRSGLIRWDFGLKMGRWEHWWVDNPETAVGYHNLKEEWEYLYVYKRVLKRFKKFKRDFSWTPPESYIAYRERGT